MLRRRAFAYTMMMIAGIISGYFIFEKCVIVRGALIMAAAGVSVAVMTRRGGMGKELPRLIVFMAAGLLLFTNSYIRYERPVVIGGQPVDLPYECSLEGKVSSVSVKEDKLTLVVSERANRIGKIRVTYRIPEYLIDAPAEEKGVALSDPYSMTGEYIRFSGKLREPDPADDPGCFDYRTYLRGHGIGHTFTAAYIDPAEGDRSDDQGRGGESVGESGGGRGSRSGRGFRLPNLSGCLVRIREGFLSLFREDVRGFVRGAVFGDKSGIDEDMRETFNSNQTGHILAVSGLHIGFLYALLTALTRRRKGLPVTLLIILAMFIYGEMTVWSASTVRAVTVTATGMAAVHLLRRFDLLTATSVSAMIILATEPYQLFDSGFQMSFMALAAIAFLTKPISHFTGDGVGIAASVQAGVVPPSVYAFHRFNALSVLINIPVIALASLLVPVCIIMLMVYAAGIPVPQPAVTATEGLCLLMIRLNELLAAGGRFSNLTVSGNPALAVMGIMMIFMLVSEWTRVMLLRHEYKEIAAASLCIILFAAALGAAAFDPFSDDEVVFVAVGQGDCTHIRAGDRDVLIDGGGDTEYNVGKNILMPYLLSGGAENVDLALVTHLHTDHYKGITELTELYPVGRVGVPEMCRTSMDDSLPAERVSYLRQGERIELSEEASIEPLWPPEAEVRSRRRQTDAEDENENENNMVYMVTYRGIRIMVTGDLLEEDELKMVEFYKGTDKLDCDVLKVAHHGSKSSSSEAFLDAAKPSIAVIQVGRNNFYGHPHQQTLDRLEARKIKVYRTDQHGAVGVDIKRGQIRIDTMRPGILE